MPTTPATLEALRERFGELSSSEFRGDTRVVLSAAQLPDVMGWLKDDRGFDLLVDVTCVDYLNYRDAADRYATAGELVAASARLVAEFRRQDYMR